MRRGAAVLAAGVMLLLSGCTGLLEGTDEANFVSGDSSVVQFDVGERSEPVEAAYDSLQGEPVDVAALRGEIVVLNFWGSWCNPCRDEAPVLAEASEQLDAAFVGAQIRDDSLTGALAFEREFGVTYPTMVDGGRTLLALDGFAPRISTPGTVILDAEGRVAALISGPVTSAATLEGLVEDARVG